MIATHIVKISFLITSDKDYHEIRREQLNRFKPILGDALENIEIEDVREGEG